MKRLDFDDAMDKALKIIVVLFAVMVLAAFTAWAMRFIVNGAEPIDEPSVSETDAEIIAQILYHECGALPKLEQSAVVWCILNRLDSELAYFPDSIEEVCKQKIGNTYMFAYRDDAPVEKELYELAADVLARWQREKSGEANVGRTLPKEYLYFWGDGRHNHFRIEYQGREYWDWSLPDPYSGGEG